ncbi:MAG: FtsW/RodA/SpoVE family cell cycle protein [Anaerorhabdus sp.]
MTVNKNKSRGVKMPLKYDRIIHISILSLALFALLVITSASMGLTNTTSGLVTIVVKQVIFTIAGYIMMVFAARIFNFKWLMIMIKPIIFLTLFLLLFTLVFDPVNGARAWIRIPIGVFDVSIQPSEFAKISAILVLAAFLGDIKYKKKTPWEFVKYPILTILLFFIITSFLQKDFGTAVVMMIISFIVFLLPKHPQLVKYQRWLFFIIIIGIIFVLFLLTPSGQGFIDMLPLQEYQKMRIKVSTNPFSQQYGEGFQLVNGLVSFASGGLFGVGFGNSIRKYTNFPAANTDYILAIVVEELGFLGFMFIFIGYGIIVWRIFKYAFKMKSEKGRMILIGTAMYIFIHFVLNVGGVTGLIPLTGVPLLIISSGGSSTMACMIAIGISQAVISKFRRGEIE